MENDNIQEQHTADQQDAFLEGWGDPTPVTEDAADQPNTEEQETVQTADNADESTEAAEDTEQSDGTDNAETAGDPDGETTPQAWSVKHLGETRELTAKDITPELLQKGLDYDRVREKYDRSKAVTDVIDAFAKSAKMTTEEYLTFIRTAAKKAEGLSEEEAKRTIALEDREAAISAKEAAETESAKAKEEHDARIKADIAEFAKAFPEVYKTAKDDPKAIPKSVWDKVNAGEMTLTSAYSMYAVEQANQRAKAAEDKAAATAQNGKNAERSTGSMKSAGDDSKTKDAFLSGWDS